MAASQKAGAPEKGVRGFDLDIHVAFAAPLPGDGAARALLALEGLTIDLYRPHPKALHQSGIPDKAGVSPVLADAGVAEVPSARLTGPLRDPDAVRGGLEALLAGQARYIEVGLRGFLRSSTGQTEWMPWRRNVVLRRDQPEQVAFEEGVRYILE